MNMLPLSQLAQGTIIGGLVTGLALTGIIPCAVEMSKKHDDDKRSIRTYPPAVMQEYNALMSHFAENFSVYKCESMEQVAPKKIGFDESLVRYKGNGGFGDWAVYQDKHQSQPSLYLITDDKCETSCATDAAIAMEKLLQYTMKEVVSMTHGLLTVIGPAQFHELLEKASIEAVTTTKETGNPPKIESIAQRMIDLANSSGQLLQHFACGSPNQVPCPEKPVGGSVHGDFSFKIDPLHNGARSLAAIARDIVDESSPSNSLELTGLPLMHPTGHGPAINHHPVSTQTEPATFVTATFTTTIAVVVATTSAVLGSTAASSIGALASALPALAM